MLTYPDEPPLPELLLDDDDDDDDDELEDDELEDDVKPEEDDEDEESSMWMPEEVSPPWAKMPCSSSGNVFLFDVSSATSRAFTLVARSQRMLPFV